MTGASRSSPAENRSSHVCEGLLCVGHLPVPGSSLPHRYPPSQTPTSSQTMLESVYSTFIPTPMPPSGGVATPSSRTQGLATGTLSNPPPAVQRQLNIKLVDGNRDGVLRRGCVGYGLTPVTTLPRPLPATNAAAYGVGTTDTVPTTTTTTQRSYFLTLLIGGVKSPTPTFTTTTGTNTNTSWT
ncbi:hypothetical protein BDN72DRAFT_905561 [Pluteus cervinus]|uniref:Uncharacterized protein n=1 Tax=Pluteus cervinus TaxID=181527 RepID=A0ACD3A1R5_9AGAR|nr:hypothetical protein BDN72DRAFT_905561 [Pluteus cervinus]